MGSRRQRLFFQTVDELREMINKESLNKEASLVIENNLNQLDSML